MDSAINKLPIFPSPGLPFTLSPCLPFPLSLVPCPLVSYTLPTLLKSPFDQLYDQRE
jgi:hypothetical protein